MQRPILAIDDSLTFRKFIGKALASSAGRYEIILGCDGREGLKLAAERKPELILLDYVLPDLRGDEVCAKLAAEPELAGIPIVLMSSSVESIQALAAQYAAVKGIIAKPFTPESLCDTVDQLMGVTAEAQTPAAAAATESPESAAFSGNTGSFPLLDALMAVQRQQLTGVFHLHSGDAAHRMVCRGGLPLGLLNGAGFYPQEKALRDFSPLWTGAEVSFRFDCTGEVPPTSPAQQVDSMLEWAMESLRHVTDEAESSYAWGDSTGIPAYNRAGYDRIQRVALTQEEIDFVKQVDARSSVQDIATRLNWPVSTAQQVLFRFLRLEVFDFWPAAILNAGR